MFVVPIVFISIVRVIMKLKGNQYISKLISRTIIMLLGTIVIASIIGIIVGKLFKLGVTDITIQLADQIKEITLVVDTLRSIFP